MSKSKLDTPDAPNEETFRAAIQDENIKNIYANGFMNALGNGDVLVLLLQNGKPEATLNLSYTVAKTLALSLSKMIQDIESASENTIMTTSDIDLALKNKGSEK